MAFTAAGKFAEAVARGRVFSVSTVVAGLAIPVSTTTSPNLLVWNPADSKVVVNLIRYVVGYVSGTMTAGTIGLQFAGGGKTLGDGLYTALAVATPVNARLGGGTGSKVYASSSATNTLAAAVVAWLPLGISLDAGLATTASLPTNTVHDFDGLVQLMPGYTVFVCASAASGALMSQSLYWEELSIMDA